ncbi:MAG: hypothetical protein AVDCRST_MAG59-962 [uncultured Thermomicrobiales bacterium]|uniref:HTH arsR-type domain-containing protein n=1 Tax=uncultured Thermomicrobiales bacterium TaxID=1645740 RepID=A0A6J4U9S8_9BACT|nr:MAG: hypothetical protein AVDCRST_MAG59-962 [uncultured Thermomicrobiales bacterium]
MSLPLDLVCVLSLLHRAVPESHFDPWLTETRAKLPPPVRDNLDLLHGFSGRLLYYPEEPAMRFRPLDPDRADASFETFIAFLLTLPPAEYLGMVESALSRTHRDLGLAFAPIDHGDRERWRVALEPCLTTAALDDVLDLVTDPSGLKRRTIDLFVCLWEAGYGDDFAANQPALNEAVRIAQPVANRPFADAFTTFTGGMPPASILDRLDEVRRVAYCPSAHLGTFPSYILYPPDLVIDFGAPEFLARTSQEAASDVLPASAGMLSEAALLELARALADPTRLRILRYLAEGERYAQEIVGHLGIAQSAVSRHLSQMERAGLIGVSPRRGLKFYSVNADTLDALAATFRLRSEGLRRDR